jgi:hypothetical protein
MMHGQKNIKTLRICYTNCFSTVTKFARAPHCYVIRILTLLLFSKWSDRFANYKRPLVINSFVKYYRDINNSIHYEPLPIPRKYSRTTSFLRSVAWEPLVYIILFEMHKVVTLTCTEKANGSAYMSHMSDSVFVFWLDRRSGFLPYWLAFHPKDMVPIFCILKWELCVAGCYQAVCFAVESLGELGLNSLLLFIISFLRKKASRAIFKQCSSHCSYYTSNGDII